MPVLDPSKTNLSLAVVVVLLGATITATAGVVRLIFQVDSLETTLRKEMGEVLHYDEFKIFVLATEKNNPTWKPADIDSIRRKK